MKTGKSIGGFFEFELLNQKEEAKERLLFNSGRSAFAFLLKQYKIKSIQLPRYTCDVILEPLKELGIAYSFYSITPKLLPDFTTGEIVPQIPLVINNYFGILDNYLEQYHTNPLVIIDNSQALYSKTTGGLGSFNSFRKFMGMPDGAEATTNELSETIHSNWPRFKVSHSINHLFGRIEDGPEAYYSTFQQADKRLTFKQINAISEISERAYFKVDHKYIADRRKNNFNYLHKKLSIFNELVFKLAESSVPLVYPLLLPNGKELKNCLIASKIYVPTYWPNHEIAILENSFEAHLVENLVALPIDQRYDIENMEYILQYIKNESTNSTT